MDRVVLELVGGVVNVKEGVIDSDDGSVWVVKSGTADKTADTSKSVDSKAERHDEGLRVVVFEVGETVNLVSKANFLVFM